MNTRHVFATLAVLGMAAASAQAASFMVLGDGNDGVNAALPGDIDFNVIQNGNQAVRFRTQNGGEFKILQTAGFIGVTGLPADLIGQSVGPNGRGTFQSFCIEIPESVTLSNTTVYHGDVNYNGTDSFARGGGTEGGASAGGSDAISIQTAFVYHNFRYGTLPGFVYQSPNGGTNRENSARALQLAIWQLEDELGTENNGNAGVFNAAQEAAFVEYTNNPLAQAFVAFANSTTWTSIGLVRAVNNFANAAQTTFRQDFLTIVVIPTPTAAGLASAGLLGLVARRRRSL